MKAFNVFVSEQGKYINEDLEKSDRTLPRVPPYQKHTGGCGAWYEEEYKRNHVFLLVPTLCLTDAAGSGKPLHLVVVS